MSKDNYLKRKIANFASDILHKGPHLNMIIIFVMNSSRLTP